MYLKICWYSCTSCIAYLSDTLFSCLSTAFNYSHRIDVLSFGPWVPGYVNPLDGDIVTTDKSKLTIIYS